MNITPVERGVMVLPFDGATPFYLKSDRASCEPRHEWYRDCYLPLETERGLDNREDQLFAGLFHAKLNLGDAPTIVVTAEAGTPLDGAASLAQRAGHEMDLLDSWQARNEKPSADAPDWLRQLVLAADQ